MSCAPTEQAVRAQWRAGHIHLPHSQHTRYLAEVIAPRLDAEGLTEHFFFLRYWQGGPHLRLRLDCEAEQADRVFTTLAADLAEFEPAAHAEYAQGLALQAELARLENEEPAPARPIGTVDRTSYDPEYRKYGGAAGIAIAETVFRRSSAAVLDLLRAQVARGATQRAPIGEAARVLAMFLAGAGVTPESATGFLRSYEDWWRRYAPEPMQRAWPTLYDGVSAQIVALCETAWRTDTEDVFRTISATATAAARAEHDVVDPRDLRLAGTPYLSCLSNYVHTTNNRLGLVPANEGLIAYLVRRGLETLGGDES